jgi:hypothetical protein
MLYRTVGGKYGIAKQNDYTPGVRNRETGHFDPL